MATALVNCPAGEYTLVASASDSVILEFRGHAILYTNASGTGVPTASADGVHFSEGDKYAEAFTQDAYVKPAGPTEINVMVSDQ